MKKSHRNDYERIQLKTDLRLVKIIKSKGKPFHICLKHIFSKKGALEHPIADVQHRIVWLGLYTKTTKDSRQQRKHRTKRVGLHCVRGMFQEIIPAIYNKLLHAIKGRLSLVARSSVGWDQAWISGNYRRIRRR